VNSKSARFIQYDLLRNRLKPGKRN